MNAGALSAATSAYLVIVALMVGSFFNLAADRLPRGESILRPRSHCRSCARVLNIVDLLPVAGYVIRGGRCATCRSPIGPSSPLIEAACGTCMVGALVWLGPWPGALLGAVLVALIGMGIVGVSLARGATPCRG